MFGKRFSISASTLAVVGACSVIFTSPVILAQGYQQTNFPGYARPQVSGLSAEATNPPAFSDTAADSSAMSPNNWGESAISNPYAGYESSAGTFFRNDTAATGNVRQQMMPARPAERQNNIDIFAPSTLSLDLLPAARKPSATTSNSQTAAAATEDSLTNTQYSRNEMQSNPFSKAGFSKSKNAELTQSPEIPKVELPPRSDNKFTDFNRIPFDPQPSTAASNNEAALEAPMFNSPSDRTPNETILERDPVESAKSFEGMISPEISEASSNDLQSPRSQANVETFFEPTVQPTQRTVQQPVVQQPVVQQPVIPQLQNQPTLPRQPQYTPNQPMTTQPMMTQPMTNQPMMNQQAVPLFTPTQNQPTYSQPAPHYAAQASGPISNEWGYGYPETGEVQSRPFVESPTHIFDHGFGTPAYRSNVAQRSGYPTTRNQTILDQGESFDHENKKKEFPPFGEIIATGRFFGSVELALLRPHFLCNTAISIDGPTFSESIPFEFDNETAPHIRFGFESKYGPGFELNYFTLNANSDAISQTFDGLAPITTIASVTGPNRFTQLSADALGETLNANHSFEVETIGFNVFKDIEFKVSRIGGRFGFTYANIAQSLEASVTDGGDNVLDTLVSTTDFRGFGPQLGIDYYRPMGHTPLEFVTSFSGMGLFGRRDQFVNNTAGLVERRFGADEFVAVLDLTSGIQYKKTIAENRAWFARLAFVHQTWLGGGTAVDPQGDFGMKGVTFGVGYNR